MYGGGDFTVPVIDLALDNMRTREDLEDVRNRLLDTAGLKV